MKYLTFGQFEGPGPFTGRSEAATRGVAALCQ